MTGHRVGGRVAEVVEGLDKAARIRGQVEDRLLHHVRSVEGGLRGARSRLRNVGTRMRCARSRLRGARGRLFASLAGSPGGSADEGAGAPVERQQIAWANPPPG